MKISFEQIFSLLVAFIFSSKTSANFFFGNVVGNNGVNSINKNVRFRYPPRTQNFMAKQNFEFGQILSKTTLKTPNKSSKNSSKNPRKNKKPKILMKSKGLLLNNNQHFKTTFKNVFGFKTSIKGLKFTPTDIKKYTGKLTKSRRQTFKWAPNGPISDYLMQGPRI